MGDAINILLGKHIVSGCIFCMSQTTPGYASAILRNDDHFYIFDSHSRDESGTVSSEGKACISQHINVTELCKFIECLAVSLNIPNAPFETAKVTLPQILITHCLTILREKT